jgi:hypothetical protein
MPFNYSYKDLLDTTLIVAYFKIVNRIALGQGITYNFGVLNGYKYEPN